MENTGKKLIGQNAESLSALIKDPGRQIVIVSHINPDGDTIGSALALLRLLQKLGHHCTVISPNEVPGFLMWLPGSEQIRVSGARGADFDGVFSVADIIYCIDFNELRRVDDLASSIGSSAAFKVLIDHHPVPQIKADYILSDTTASSTAEIVYRYMKESGYHAYIDKDIATCIFTGIMTDTGCFSYNSSRRNTWLTIADLIEYGIDKDRIYGLTYDNYSAQRMRLLGYALNDKLEVFPEYRTGIIVLSRQDLEKFHFEVGDSEGFVNYPLSIKGISFSALFIEKDDHIKISFRSKGNFAVNDFSKRNFNGGGHRNASGGEYYAGLSDTVKHFKDLLPEYKEKLCCDE